MAASEPAIRARGVELHQGGGGFVLEVPEFELRPGEQVALEGPSGTGKSTLLSALCGLLVPAAGELEVLGIKLQQASADARQGLLRRGLSVLFQDLILLEYLDVSENALLPARLAGPERLARARGELPAWLSRLGLAERAGARPLRLSGGERQRAALLRALLDPRPVVLLDEPTSALDPALAARALEALLECCAARGAALLLVSHDPATLRRLPRRLATRSLGPGRARLEPLTP
jgi:ABC-type lipoprotein export system ATPase subunit